MLPECPIKCVHRFMSLHGQPIPSETPYQLR